MNIETKKYRITLLEPMLGTVPKNKEIYKDYVQKKARDSGIDTEALDKEIDTVEDIEDKGWTGFHSDENGLFIYDYLFKGFLKNSINLQKEALDLRGARSKLDNYVFVFPRKIYLNKSVPDGVYERPLRASTPQGERVALVKSDIVDSGSVFEIEIRLIDNKSIDFKLIKQVLDYGQFKGLGQFRNGSFGRFSYEEIE